MNNQPIFSPQRWQFWIDRGGTFTDIVAQRPDGRLVTHKLLSDNPQHYQDAAVQGIRELLNLAADEPLPGQQIASVKMGTTVATNALLERRGERTVLVITQGFADALRIGYQNRPDLFALNIVLPEMLFEQVIEVDERYTATGEELKSVPLATVRQALYRVREQGIDSVAIVFMHGYRYPQHEQQVAAVARELGFSQVSVSHEVSPLIKLVSRGDTTVVDAYLSPILRRYVNNVAKELGDVKLLFMQSNGGLTEAQLFQGKDAIVSGPAGGYVGAVKTAALAGFEKIINFDMGGTSTDVSHYAGDYERAFETEIAGVRMRTPIMRIHTVAAGGGSIIHFDGARFRVGPDSAGAKPGPAAYRQGGPLTITDCNVILGKLHGRFFPQVFGPAANEALDEVVVLEKMRALADEIGGVTGQSRTATQVAEGFLKIAVDNMANAIKKISVQRGYDVTQYTLCCFGAAGGQHACLVAEALGIKTIFIHPHAGVLSALGMGLADIRSLHEQSVTKTLDDNLLPELETIFHSLAQQGREALYQQAVSDDDICVQRRVHLRYAGTDSSLLIDFNEELPTAFATAHQQRFGFSRPKDTPLIVEAVSVEVIGSMPYTTAQPTPPLAPSSTSTNQAVPLETVTMISGNQAHATPVYWRQDLLPGQKIMGPAQIIENTSTTIIEPGWQAEITPRYELILTQQAVGKNSAQLGGVTTAVDPVMLEVFNNLFMSIAEQMGATLANTAYSVNIKERLDFSCAVFDQQGQLIANAPHIPIHLGSMGDSVQTVIADFGAQIAPGEVFMLNNPYRGGTHLPDITVITPFFLPPTDVTASTTSLFYVASRGHHADIGGITPGSMPPHSRTLMEEGIVIDVVKLVEHGQLQESAVEKLLLDHPFPARNIAQNLADLRAQIAANATGVQQLQQMIQQFGLAVVQAYMQHVQDHAEMAVRQLLSQLKSGAFCYELDNGAIIRVQITIDQAQSQAMIDFTGTSPQQDNNFNAPLSVCKAAVLYVLRTLIGDNIPLNAGCLKPIQLIVPAGCLLNPSYPAAVVAGNVETSQYITDTLYGALGIMAASQGTMNNFTFGNQDYQYYETLCGGTGAGADFHGTSAVHSHMTNSRLTDPEVLEWRFPVLIESFAIRPNSGGTGQYRGGDGVIRKIRFRQAMTAAILSSHRRISPYGMAGGQSGQVGKNWLERADGHQEMLAGTAIVELEAGDMIVIETPGGGGYG
jgi:5-oxoprolinase (ATP-hydrolysing)